MKEFGQAISCLDKNVLLLHSLPVFGALQSNLNPTTSLGAREDCQ